MSGPAKFCKSGAVTQVVIDEARRLHERIANGAADKSKTTFFQVF